MLLSHLYQRSSYQQPPLRSFAQNNRITISQFASCISSRSSCLAPWDAEEILRLFFFPFLFFCLAAVFVCRVPLPLLQLHRQTWLTPAWNRPSCLVYKGPNAFTLAFFKTLWRLFLTMEEQEAFVFRILTLFLLATLIFKLRDAEPEQLPYWSQLR